jgi:hypothetical protein
MSTQILQFLTNFEAIYSKLRPKLKKWFNNTFVENFLKILNLFSEVCYYDAELTSILWRENCTLILPFCIFSARTKADVTEQVWA